jgi:hypothetical protein
VRVEHSRGGALRKLQMVAEASSCSRQSVSAAGRLAAAATSNVRALHAHS